MGKVLRLWAYRDSDGKMAFFRSDIDTKTVKFLELWPIGQCHLDEAMLVRNGSFYRYRPPDVRLSFGGA
jgi:hypothetical protein